MSTWARSRATTFLEKLGADGVGIDGALADLLEQVRSEALDEAREAARSGHDCHACVDKRIRALKRGSK